MLKILTLLCITYLVLIGAYGILIICVALIGRIKRQMSKRIVTKTKKMKKN